MNLAYEYGGYVAAMYEQKYEAEQSDLPDHLQLSDESARNPWQNMFMQDFVLVAEFCEQEGPRPLVSNLFTRFRNCTFSHMHCAV